MARKMPRRLVALSAAAIAAIYVTGYVATQGADARLGISEAATTAPIVAAAPAAAVGSGLAPRVVPAPPVAQQPVQGQQPRIQSPPGQAPPYGQTIPSRRGSFQGEDGRTRGGDRDGGEREGGFSRGSRDGTAGTGIARTNPSVSNPPAVSAPAPSQSSTAPVAQAAAQPAAQSSASAATYRDGTYTGSGTSRRGGFTVAVTIQGGKITDVQFTRVTTQYPVSRVAGLPAQVIARQSAQVDRVTGATYSVQAFQQAVESALAQAQSSAPINSVAGA